MERPDTFAFGFISGVVFVFGVIGAAQMLVTKGYMIAAELVDAGWNARELRSHRKAAIVLPFIEKMRAESQSQR